MAASPLLLIIAAAIAIPLAIVLVIYLVVPLFKGIAWIVRHVSRFVFGEIGDALRVIGSILLSIVLIPMTVGSVLIGRWSASAHYGRAVQSEIASIGRCIYRIIIGHPARFLCLGAALEGIEKRLPEVVAAAPGADKPRKSRAGQFAGYTIVGSLSGGGSGGRLYVARPEPIKAASLERAGHRDVDQVVIKTFSLHDGSSLPQIVRESRALDAAKKLGLVLDHELTNDRFFYVMRFVPGEALGLVTHRLHAESPPDGLGTTGVRRVLGYAADIVGTLATYHRGGLWHKDVKPDNIIVDRDRCHLVDFGLVTPLRAAVTLTTHGTEYFRDPEMVRLALKGVKVHEVDGAKFDIYAAGAVLYSMIENSFPAHGSLSQVTRRCPDALRWIMRRAMADYDRRYASATEMLEDLEAVRSASDPFALKPAMLPSMTRTGAAPLDLEEPEPQEPVGLPRSAPPRREPPVPPPPAERRRPKLRVTGWWTGRYALDPAEAPHAASPTWAIGATHGRTGPPPWRAEPAPRVARTPRVNNAPRRPATEQLASARARVRTAQRRARERAESHKHRAPPARSYSNNPNAGVAVAIVIFLGACVGVAAFVYRGAATGPRARVPATPSPSLYLAGALPDTAAGATAPARSRSDGFIITVPGHDPGAPIAARMLVLSDLPLPLSADMTRRVETSIQRLRTAGFTVISNLIATIDDDELGEEYLDLAAEAHERRNLAPLDSPSAEASLREWLLTRDDVDLLLWLEPDRARPGDARFHLYAPEPTDNAARRRQTRAVFDVARASLGS